MRALPLAALVSLAAACQSGSSSQPPRARRPAPRADASAVARPAQAPPADAPATQVSAVVDGGEEAPAGAGPRVFRVGQSACNRDPGRQGLGAGIHGAFQGDRVELEVRNVRFSCTPSPVYEVRQEANWIRVQYRAAPRDALARCQCPHDQFLQVTGVAPGTTTVRLEELSAGDGGAFRVVANGTLDAPEGAASARTGG